MYQLKVTKTFGRGLYASEIIKAGTLVTSCELLVLDENDTKTVNQTTLQFYTFRYNDKQDCLVMGDGEIFNHDDSPNVEYRLMLYNNGISTQDNRSLMCFIALRDIQPGEQLFIDYKADVPDAVPERYNINLM